ncbi:MAG: PAS domain S-box protein [Nitrospirae bacterium]|nr:MAG: PAS domain S-box protein [Nitrospirota bacterium]
MESASVSALTSIVAASVLIMTALAIFLLTMGRLKTELTKRDMTPRRQADEELRESEERYRKLLGATFQAIVIHTDEGIILEVNHAFEIMFGIPGMLATGLTILAFLVERTRELFIAQIQQRRESSFEGIGLRMDGTWLDIEVVSKAHTYKGQPILATAIRNITARKRYGSKAG